MIQKFGDKIIKFGSRIPVFGETLRFVITASKFPLVVDQNNVATIDFIFNKATTVIVNYGNGIIQPYNTVFNRLTLYDVGANYSYSPPVYAQPGYVYSDGLTIERTISISLDRNALTYLHVGLVKLDNQNFTFEFSKYPNLYHFGMSQVGLAQAGAIIDLNLTNIPSNTQLKELIINRAFTPASRYYYSIPIEIFSLPLTDLYVGTGGLSSVTFSASNLDKIALLAPTLKNLQIQGDPFTDTNNGQGALPSNFNLLQLNMISLLSVNYTMVPSVINSIISLKILRFGFSTSITSYGDFSALVNLEELQFQANLNMPATIPSWFANFTKLKRLVYNAMGFTIPGKLDTFITNLYNFVVATAPITGTSTDLWRSVIVLVPQQATGDGTEIPSGTLQQPAGYVQGVSNGTPVSSKERIWVLQSQYAHFWTYRQV